jgi:DNA-binding response OmpR family regulator
MAKLKPGSKRILVVDDDARICALLKDILSNAGYGVQVAEDGLHALEILGQYAPDLLIVDRSMPRLDGLELLRKLREGNRLIPAIMISAYGEERFWAQAIGCGAEDYLVKPFSNEAVLKIVKQRLG